jgi:hypothetical protein
VAVGRGHGVADEDFDHAVAHAVIHSIGLQRSTAQELFGEE